MISTFEEAWKRKEAEGYQYGEDALEQVRFGWEIALEALTNEVIEYKAALIQLRADGEKRDMTCKTLLDDARAKVKELKEALEQSTRDRIVAFDMREASRKDALAASAALSAAQAKMAAAEEQLSAPKKKIHIRAWRDSQGNLHMQSDDDSVEVKVTYTDGPG